MLACIPQRERRKGEEEWVTRGGVGVHKSRGLLSRVREHKRSKKKERKNEGAKVVDGNQLEVEVEVEESGGTTGVPE